MNKRVTWKTYFMNITTNEMECDSFIGSNKIKSSIALSASVYFLFLKHAIDNIAK